jgi:hypothetical protein
MIFTYNLSRQISTEINGQDDWEDAIFKREFVGECEHEFEVRYEAEY